MWTQFQQCVHSSHGTVQWTVHCAVHHPTFPFPPLFLPLSFSSRFSFPFVLLSLPFALPWPSLYSFPCRDLFPATIHTIQAQIHLHLNLTQWYLPRQFPLAAVEDRRFFVSDTTAGLDGRSLEQDCDFNVVIDQASMCLFALADWIQSPEKPITEVFSRSRLIVHHSIQQPKFPRCIVRFVIVVEESPHLKPILFLKMMKDATQSFATHQSLQSGSHDLFFVAPALPHDRLTHSQIPRGASDNQIENLNAQLSKTLGSPFHSYGRPRLQSDPTPNVHSCVNSRRVSYSSLATPTGAPSPGTGICCAAAAVSAGSPVNISTRELDSTLSRMAREMKTLLNETAKCNNQISVHASDSATKNAARRDRSDAKENRQS